MPGLRTLEQALEQGGAKVIVIDPRYSDTVATRADQWIPIRPGTDAALVDAVAHTLIEEDLVDHDFLATYCIGYDEDTMPESAQGQNKSYKAYIMGQGVDGVENAACRRYYGDSRRYHCRAGTRDRHCETLRHLPRQGPQRQSNGEQTARAICMLPVLTGNVGINGGNTGSDLDGFYFSSFSVPSDKNPVQTSNRYLHLD